MYLFKILVRKVSKVAQCLLSCVTRHGEPRSGLWGRQSKEESGWCGIMSLCWPGDVWQWRNILSSPHNSSSINQATGLPSPHWDNRHNVACHCNALLETLGQNTDIDIVVNPISFLSSSSDVWCLWESCLLAAVRRLSLIWLNKYCPNKNTIKGEQRKLSADHQAGTVCWSLDICCSIKAGEMKWLELTCELCGLYTRGEHCSVYSERCTGVCTPAC